MIKNGLVDFNISDGFTPLQMQKLNTNFKIIALKLNEIDSGNIGNVRTLNNIQTVVSRIKANLIEADTAIIDDLQATSIVVGNTLIYDTSYVYNQARTSVTFTAHLYRGGEDIKAEYPEECFTWWFKSENWVQGEPLVPLTSNGDYTCTVLLSSVGYGATIIGRFTPPNDSVILDEDDDTITDSSDTPISGRIPSGDYVRVSDFETVTTVFDSDKMLIIGTEGENLISIENLKEIFGSSSYNNLSDKPQIEGVTLQGNKSFEELNMNKITNVELEEMLV